MSEKNIKIDKDLYLPAAIVLASVIIGGSLVYTGNPQGSAVLRERGTASVTQGTDPSPSPSPQPNGSKVDFTITEDDHIRGNPDAPVTLVEFSDMECPFCSRFHPTAQQAIDEYRDQLRWVYKHFPLDNIHSEARPAAEASECVWEQKGDEGFWRFADAMFEQQNRLGSEFYREVAEQIGVNMSQFDDCVSSRKYQDKVEKDYQDGLQAGVTGTPGSFVNGTPVKGAVPYTQLKSIIDQEL